MRFNGKLVHKIVVKPVQGGFEARFIGNAGRGNLYVMKAVRALDQSPGDAVAILLDWVDKEEVP